MGQGCLQPGRRKDLLIEQEQQQKNTCTRDKGLWKRLDIQHVNELPDKWKIKDDSDQDVYLQNVEGGMQEASSSSVINVYVS